MTVKSGLMLRQVAGQWIIIPLGQRTVEFNAIMSLSETGALIWRDLEENLSSEQILNHLISEYEIGEKTAKSDLDEFISLLLEKGLLEV